MSIVGKDFLPRGQGNVTRRPLVLQLIHTPIPPEPNPTASPHTECAQFLHTDKRFTDFSGVCREIEQETYRVAGQNKGISKLSTNTPSDIRPGCVGLDVGGPSWFDKEFRFPSVINQAILNGKLETPLSSTFQNRTGILGTILFLARLIDHSIVLSVSAANIDLANSDSLKLARTVDPQGRRTIGVLTKLDLMDAGTNALDVLTGQANRTSTEKRAWEALESETEFFRNHPAYRNISHKNGTKYLAKTLNMVLMNHIRDKLSDMKARLNALMGQAQQEPNSFGDAAIFGDKNQQGSIVLRLMTQFARDFISSIEGTKIDVSTKELTGGARIYYIFHDVFRM
ncbi:dynamin 1-like protein [Amanita rubescens]|nr:dynamin 1-like protein [Amanita rubescens]